MLLNHNRMVNLVYNKVETGGEWNGKGESKICLLSALLPATNGRRINRGLGVDSCYHHCYEGPRLAQLASGAFTDIMAVPAATASFQTLIVFLQDPNFSRYM